MTTAPVTVLEPGAFEQTAARAERNKTEHALSVPEIDRALLVADHQALTELLGAEVERAGALESLVAQLATRLTTAVAVPAAVAEPAAMLSTEVFL